MSHLLRPVRAVALALAVALASAAALGLAADGQHLTGVVNVNTASLEELQLLPGVGETRARAIVAARKQRGGFKSLDELVEVKGIGETSLTRLRPFVRLDGKTTARIE